jgi:7-keto-8-aminopelargonate synthetase-like enzyme
MSHSSQTIDFIDVAVAEAVNRGLFQLNAEDTRLDGRSIRIRERPSLNFGSCSYLGLEMDPRLKRGTVDAAERYGTQFSCSRAYLAAPPYQELEALLDRVFDAHTLVAASTTLAHLSALPVLVREEDAVILDQQVHQSVQMAASPLRLKGSRVDLVRHGRIDLLEQKIRELAASHRRIWYLGDGVYSMFGEFAPMKALSWLLARYEQLRLYIDDAHGMSWRGRNGRGFAAEALHGEERVVVAVSLNKAFAAAGGALVFFDPELRRKVHNCGGTLMFGGPIQPPMLGAALASARIHLSPEIEQLQGELRERIVHANRVAAELDLPLASTCEIPIRYVGLGLKPAMLDTAAHLLERGIYANPAAFPAVGSRSAGMRFTLTRHHSLEDIRLALETIAERIPTSLAKAGSSREEVDRAFGLHRARRRATPARPVPCALSCRHEITIRALDAREWDGCLADRGSFDAASLALLEDTFGPDGPPEHRWRFHYYVVRDAAGRPVLATFFTEALWKDDLLATARVSRAVEERRAHDPYFLTSRTLAMGSLLTEGEHLYLDRDADWRGALQLLLSAVNEVREECGSPALPIRDVPDEDAELGGFLRDAGFARVDLPDAMVVDVDWSGPEEFLAKLASHERRFHRKNVLPWADAYEVEVLAPGGRWPSEAEWDHLHHLYRNVQERQLTLNTFPLPDGLLPRMLRCPGWELVLLRLRPERGGPGGPLPQGFVVCHAGAKQYDWLLVGMDYDFVESHALYRQLIAQVIRRAEALGLRRIDLGMSSEQVKRRFGAKPIRRAMYVQSYDRFHHEMLELLAADAHLRERS